MRSEAYLVRLCFQPLELSEDGQKKTYFIKRRFLEINQNIDRQDLDNYWTNDKANSTNKTKTTTTTITWLFLGWWGFCLKKKTKYDSLLTFNFFNELLLLHAKKKQILPGSDSADGGSGSAVGAFEFLLADVLLINCSDACDCFCISGKLRHVAFNLRGRHPRPTQDVPFTTATISISFFSFKMRQWMR